MAKRMILMLLVMAAFIAAIGLTKYRQIQTAVAQAASFQPPPEAVTTIVAREETWQPTLKAIGTVAAVHGVVVSADLPGVVRSISFESGQKVRQGASLVRLDTSQEQSQLQAAEARLKLAELHLARIRGLLDKGVASPAEFDTAVALQEQGRADAGEIRATIGRKTIEAPFPGILGIRQVNMGQYLKSGDGIVSLQSLDPIYVNFSVPQQELPNVGVGRDVTLAADDAGGPGLSGRITAIESTVDEATRNVEIQATFENTDGALRPGMFVNVQVHLERKDPVITVPASSISYAPYGDSVFIVEQVKSPQGKEVLGVRQQFVKVGGTRGDQIAILSGVKPGEQVVTSGVFKLRNGAAVQVNNDVQPSNDPSPKPEDN
ncbi:MAG TPA: efflux RND transporter periplasmic adaptor subunit [Candidatus Polarisedimenticolia bacterium]|nr:efflux RND transporter periplasmic adaptor subunit [Candidatus Polarisedimenticolia bacterium]